MGPVCHLPKESAELYSPVTGAGAPDGEPNLCFQKSPGRRCLQQCYRRAGPVWMWLGGDRDSPDSLTGILPQIIQVITRSSIRNFPDSSQGISPIRGSLSGMQRRFRKLVRCAIIIHRSCYQEVRGPQAGGPFPFAKRGDVDEGTAPAYPRDAGSPYVPAVRQADPTGRAAAPGAVLLARLRRDNLWYTDPAFARADGDRRVARRHALATRWRDKVPPQRPRPPSGSPGGGRFSPVALLSRGRHSGARFSNRRSLIRVSPHS